MPDQKVTVILINYNSLVHTEECIRSLKKSSYDNLEIVVVDNASNESCQKLKELFSDIIIIENDDNYGFAVANNVGINYAIKNHSDYIFLLNNDTVVEKDSIMNLVRCCLQNNNSGIVTGKILNYYNRDLIWYAGGRISRIKGDATIFGFGKRNTEYFDKSFECSFASGCCMLIPRKVARDFSLSDKYFLYYEDCDYCMRIIQSGKKIYYESSAIIYHKESISTNKKSYIYSYYFARNRLLFIKENISYPLRGISYFVAFLSISWRCFRGLMIVKPTIDGIADFFKGYIGKCKRNY